MVQRRRLEMKEKGRRRRHAMKAKGPRGRWGLDEDNKELTMTRSGKQKNSLVRRSTTEVVASVREDEVGGGPVTLE